MSSANTPFIHLNAAGASIISSSVLQAQVDYLYEEQKFGGYVAADHYQAVWHRLYQQLAQLINCHSTQIALQESASRAMQNALLSIPWEMGDQVLVSSREYGAHWVALQQLKQKYDLVIKIIPEEHGEIDWTTVTKLLSEPVKAVIVTWVGSHNGGVFDVVKLGQLVQESTSYYLVDGCQAVGQLPVDVAAINCDFLTVTGRKFLRAPRGTGFLYVSEKVLKQGLFPIITDHAAAYLNHDNTLKLDETAKRFELWEANWVARAGMQQAVDELLANQHSTYHQIHDLSLKLRHRLQQSNCIELTDTGAQQSAIISFRHLRASVKQVKQVLDDHNIFSSVITKDAGWLDLHQRNLSELNRFSVHVYNTPDEFDLVVRCLESL